MIYYIEWVDILVFKLANRDIWKVNGEVAGYGKNYGNFNFVWVIKAGHMVPHD